MKATAQRKVVRVSCAEWNENFFPGVLLVRLMAPTHGSHGRCERVFPYTLHHGVINPDTGDVEIPDVNVRSGNREIDLEMTELNSDRLQELDEEMSRLLPSLP